MHRPCLSVFGIPDHTQAMFGSTMVAGHPGGPACCIQESSYQGHISPDLLLIRGLVKEVTRIGGGRVVRRGLWTEWSKGVITVKKWWMNSLSLLRGMERSVLSSCSSRWKRL